MSERSPATCPFEPQRGQNTEGPAILRAAPPGPSGYPVVGHLPFLFGDSLVNVTNLAREYGDIFQYRAFHRRICFVNHPDYIQDVLVTNGHKFIRGKGVQANSRFFGRGLFTNDAESWRHQRRVMQPAFHQRAIQRFASLAVERTEKMLAGWRHGQSIDIYRSMGALALDIAARILFDVEIEDQTHKIAAAVRALQTRNARGQVALYAMKYLPTPRNIRYTSSIRRLEKLVYRLIRERRATGRDGDDLLSMLLEARDERGNPMSERQIRDEIMTVIVGAYDTTALAISYACYLLGKHPEAGAELAAELRHVLGDRPPCLDDLPKLTYLDGVMKEAMRLYPPAPLLAREATEDLEIGGYQVLKRTTVIVCQWLTHRDARYFDAPGQFRPRRWTREFEQRLHKFAYFPFGAGNRKCIGMNLGRMEAALILATVVQRIGMRPAPEFTLKVVPCINLQAKNGVQMVLGERFGEAQRSSCDRNW